MVSTQRPSFTAALLWWAWLGLISFGGPAGQIATLHTELVERRRWISERRFLHALDYCMLLPGPEAQQLATYMGWVLHGVPGALAAGLLFILPGFFVLVGLSALYVAFGELPLVATVLATLKPAVVAVIVAAAWRIGRRALKTWPARGIAAAALIAALLGVGFPWIVLAAAALGAALRLPSSAHGAAGEEDEPIPPAPWAAIPALLGGALALYLVLPDALQAMARFFTGAALLTFGGAYAVLPYVQAGGVAHGWITGPQMLDGLALGETTPGPLILVVTFVGYLGAGLAGAVVATLYTFVPSFVFILGGAPLVERSHRVPALGAPLAGITAAVVGVILHLAVTLGAQVLVEPVAWTIGGCALIALLGFNQSVPRVTVAAMLLGLLRGV